MVGYSALPGWAIDLIRDGVPAAELKARGGGAVWSSLVRTAMSAQNHGWGVVDWEFQILEDGNNLGRQVSSKDGKRRRTRKWIAKQLDDAWETAWERTSSEAAWTPEQVAEEVERRAAAASITAADPDVDLSDTDRAVLAYAAEQHRARGMTRVALPWRAVQEATGLGERATKNALRRLTNRGLLNLDIRGRSDPDPKKRRAHLFALPDAATFAARVASYLCRGTRPMGPPAQTYGTPSSLAAGTPAQTYGTPLPDSGAAVPAYVQSFIEHATPESLRALLEAAEAAS